jgi:predicted enzyme related to lactoylglutathione lyase
MSSLLRVCADVARTLNELEHHYSQIAKRFDWTFTPQDLAELLDRPDQRQRDPPVALAAGARPGSRRATIHDEIMITGAHAIIFTENAAAVREFFKDALGLSSVDAGDGWLIFALPTAELAAHPADNARRHELYLMCDDIHATAAELETKGVEFSRPISHERWGLTTAIKMPDGGELGLYEPRHPTPSPRTE